ncbi:hypothetical protein [Nocardioides daeguensis]|uniref:Ig-like domain-containing protein n=1 Tax=Nocardioides daeguensis TaxID=908359 RepID=A0ABP6UZ07_9ACTN|nr:hypothetical protein [Nocardioides daeguensis]MBV6727068.1 hypothetical protein [Nocardioides daeguensis]MCR1771529.1 hypothetical protein [Nocardioides daeguensis]
MNRPARRRTAACVAVAAIAAGGLASIPSSALATVDYTTVGGRTYASASIPSGQTYTCNRSGTADGSNNVTWTDNGVPVTRSFATSTTFTRSNATTDKTTVQTSGSATVTATPVSTGAAPATITGSASVTASATSALASTGCTVYGDAYRRAEGGFTLTQPMWATISGSGDGTGRGSVYVYDETSQTGIELGPRASGSTTVLLPAGEVGVSFGADVYVSASGTREEAASYSGTFRIDLQPVGAAGAVDGKGAGYVQLGARDCATGTVAAVVTKKAKKKARSVLVRANGAKVAKLKGKKLKPTMLAVPANRLAPVTVSAKVALKNGKKATVTRSYLAC